MPRARFEASWTHDELNGGDSEEQSIDVTVDDKAVIIGGGPWSLWLDATSAAALSAAIFNAAEASISDD